jgi:hypothetical protein
MIKIPFSGTKNRQKPRRLIRLLKQILDTKYEKANLDELIRKCSYLTQNEQFKLLKLLQKHGHLFNGTLGRWDGRPYNIKLKPDATPYHARAFPIPKVKSRRFEWNSIGFVNLACSVALTKANWPLQHLSFQRKMVPFDSSQTLEN